MKDLYYSTETHEETYQVEDGPVIERIVMKGDARFLSKEDHAQLAAPEFWMSVQMEHEAEATAEAEAEAAQTKIHSFGVKEGAAEVKLSPSQRVLSGIAEAFRDQLKDAKNYVEMQMQDQETGEVFLLTIQRKNGKTPHQLRTEAEASVANRDRQIDKLEDTYDELVRRNNIVCARNERYLEILRKFNIDPGVDPV